VKAELYKLCSISLCSNTVGQVRLHSLAYVLDWFSVVVTLQGSPARLLKIQAIGDVDVALVDTV
jgi:hypothetical protein